MPWTDALKAEFVGLHLYDLPEPLSAIVETVRAEPMPWVPETAVAWDRLVGDGVVEAPPLDISNFDSRCTVNGVVLDSNVGGVGATPNSSNIRYMGFGVMMPPETFLRLISRQLFEREKYDGLLLSNHPQIHKYLKDRIDTIGWAPPQLYFDYDTPARTITRTQSYVLPAITGHEGKSRMSFLMHHTDVDEILVHMYWRYYRSRHVTEGLLHLWNQGMYSQTNPAEYVQGPLYSRVIVDPVEH